MLLTIITVTYNAEQWIERTLSSILAQSEQDYECLVIDGASTDHTMAVVQRMQPLFHGRLSFISEPDEGIYDAMNKGIRNTKGQFIWFLNAGDELTKNALSLAFPYMQTSTDLIYGKTLTTDADGQITGQYHKTPPQQLQLQSLTNGLVVCHQAMAVRRAIAPYYDTSYRIAADYDWVIRILTNTNKTTYIPDYLCRFLKGGMSQQNKHKAWKERFRIMRKHFGLLATLYYHIPIAFRYLFLKHSQQ